MRASKKRFTNEPGSEKKEREREETKSPTGTEIKMICCGKKSEATRGPDRNELSWIPDSPLTGTCQGDKQ